MSVIDFKKLRVQIDDTDDAVTYSFSGEIAEQFERNKIPKINRPKIYFNLKNVQNINSIGIGEWLFFLQDFRQAGMIIYQECSIPMIDQANMISESLANGKVESFYAPYYCSCGNEESVRIEVKQHLKQLLEKTAPEFKCKECEKQMEFDALEENYFNFVTNQQE